MTTMSEVKKGWEKLNQFRSRNSFFEFHAASTTVEDFDRLPEMMTERLQLNTQATALFEEIGKQVCADHGIEWGSKPEGLTDDSTISDEAESKFRIFLNFIESH